MLGVDMEARRRGRRIAVFIPSLRGGGAERAMVALANGFVRQGYAVDLVLAKADGVFRAEVSDKVRIVDLGSNRMLLSLHRLVAYLRRVRPESLLSAMSHVNLVAIWSRYLSGVKARVVVSERSTFTLAMEKLKRRRIAAWLMPKLIRVSYPMADAVVSVSAGVQNDLMHHVCLKPDRAHVIYNPVVDDDFGLRASVPLNHPWFLPGEPPVVLAVGRLTEAKNYPLLIRAFARLRARRECRLLILGEGSLRVSLEALVAQLDIGSHVLMPGFVDNPFPYMRRAAVFVLSSSWEGLPGALIQAMACGCRVVSTDCPSGPGEILEHGRWGRLIPVGDEDALVDAIAECMDDESPPDVAARACFFNEARSVDAYLRLLFPPDGQCSGDVQ